jgi:hypothetical protein
MNNQESNRTRRDFLKKSSAIAALSAVGPFINLHAEPQRTLPQDEFKMNGIQIGAVSFVDEGVNQVLDIVQEKAGVNTLFLTVFTHGRGLAGRQIPGKPFPDHGKQESDESYFHGGNFAIPNPEFYTNTVLKETRAPDHGDFDILGDVIPEARKRGMKIFASLEDQWRTDIPGINDLREIDLYGRKANTLDLFKPDVREFWKALAKDVSSSYDIDGVLFFNERNGPLLNALGASHFQTIDSSRVTSFSNEYQAAAKEHGIDFDRAKEGFQKLDEFIKASLDGKRPSDGYYVEFQRLMLKYPEIVAYDKLFDHAKHEVLREVYETVKSVNSDYQVGFHIEHVNSFNPFFRATRSYEELGDLADFFKVVAYNNCGGERYANFIKNIGSTIFRDVPNEELMRLNNHILNYSENEASLPDLPAEGLSADYVYRETKRAIDGVKGKAKILTGIDIGIPVSEGSRIASAEDTYKATSASFKAGSDGIILSRKYSEMNMANLEGAGKAVKESESRKV